jgi:hypothetical protein
MNLKEYAAEKGISLDEAKTLTGLTHWKQEVMESAPVGEVIKPIVIETKSKVTLEEARALRTGVGDKTKAFLVFVNDNKDALPEEYERVKHNIAKYL